MSLPYARGLHHLGIAHASDPALTPLHDKPGSLQKKSPESRHRVSNVATQDNRQWRGVARNYLLPLFTGFVDGRTPRFTLGMRLLHQRLAPLRPVPGVDRIGPGESRPQLATYGRPTRGSFGFGHSRLVHLHAPRTQLG